MSSSALETEVTTFFKYSKNLSLINLIWIDHCGSIGADIGGKVCPQDRGGGSHRHEATIHSFR